MTVCPELKVKGRGCKNVHTLFGRSRGRYGKAAGACRGSSIALTLQLQRNLEDGLAVSPT